MSDDPVVVGRMPGSPREEWSWRLWMGGALLGLLGVMLWHLPDPETRPWVFVAGPFFAACFASMLDLDTRLDTTHGRLLHRRAHLVRWQAVWGEAAVLRVQANPLGMVALQVRSAGRRRWSVRVPLVAVDDRGVRSQPVAVLRLLAAEIRRWAAPRHHPVADELDAQADHLAAGGSIPDSPLMFGPRVRRP